MNENAPDRSDGHIVNVMYMMSTIVSAHLIRGTVLKTISECKLISGILLYMEYPTPHHICIDRDFLYH